MPETLGNYFVERKQAGRAGLPVYSVTLESGLLPRDSLDRRTESALGDEGHALVKRGDLAYNMMRMWQGALGIAERDCLVSPAYVVMKPKPIVDVRFAAAWMKSTRGLNRLWAYSHGITDDRLRLYADDFLSIRVSFPSLPEQRRIVAVLDTWDDAIATVEHLVKAKRRRLTGLINSLLTDAAAPREELVNFATLQSDKIDVSDADFDESIELEDLESGTARLLGRTRIDGLNGQRARFRAGDTLFGKLRPYLRKSYFADADGIASTEMWVLRADPKRCLPRYLSFLVRSPLFEAEANRPTGSRMPRADWSWVQEVPLPLPNLGEQERIVAVLSAADQDVNNEFRLLDHLRHQRRGLMEKLVTGEWRLPDQGDPFTPGAPAAERLAAATPELTA